MCRVICHNIPSAAFGMGVLPIGNAENAIRAVASKVEPAMSVMLPPLLHFKRTCHTSSRAIKARYVS